MARGHKDALIAAARTLLRRKGLQATTARDLVEESGTNLASIGYHFGGKDALMGAALTDLFREWTARPVTASIAAIPDGPGESAAAAIRTMLADLRERRPEILAYAEAVVASGRGEPIGAELPAALRGSLAAVASAIREASPGIPPEFAAASAAVVVAVHDGLALQSTVTPDSVPDPETVLVVLAGMGAILLPVLGLDADQIRMMIQGTGKMAE